MMLSYEIYAVGYGGCWYAVYRRTRTLEVW